MARDAHAPRQGDGRAPVSALVVLASLRCATGGAARLLRSRWIVPGSAPIVGAGAGAGGPEFAAPLEQAASS